MLLKELAAKLSISKKRMRYILRESFPHEDYQHWVLTPEMIDLLTRRIQSGRSKHLSEEVKLRIEELHSQGVTHREISLQVGCGVESVLRVLNPRFEQHLKDLKSSYREKERKERKGSIGSPNNTMTPKKLGAKLSSPGKTIKKLLRDNFPRSVEDKGKPWAITPEMVDFLVQRKERIIRRREILKENRSKVTVKVKKEGLRMIYGIGYGNTIKWLEFRIATCILEEKRWISEGPEKREKYLEFMEKIKSERKKNNLIPVIRGAGGLFLKFYTWEQIAKEMEDENVPKVKEEQPHECKRVG